MSSSLASLVQSSRQQLDAASARHCADYSARGGRIFCGPGCSNCCSLVVNATLPEALALAASLNPAQVAAVKGHVEAMLAEWDDQRDLKGYLRWHRRSVGLCPLLTKGGECGVYPLRPLACRSLLATRPADWCAVDFGSLDRLEKELFMGSLDRSAAAFPTHYFAASQELGQELEQRLTLAQQEAWGFSLSGNLNALIYLQVEFGIAEVVGRGGVAVAELLRSSGLDRPLLLHFNPECAALLPEGEGGRRPDEGEEWML